MRVSQGHLDAGVTKDLLKLEEVPSPHDPVARERVPQAVKRDVPAALAVDHGALEPSPIEDTMKDLLEYPRRRSEHAAITVGEDQIAWMPQSPGAQEREQRVEYRDAPDATTLGRPCIAATPWHT